VSVRRIGLALSNSYIVSVTPRREREAQFRRHRKTGQTQRCGFRGSGRLRRRLDEAFSPLVLSHVQSACGRTPPLSAGPKWPVWARTGLSIRARVNAVAEAPAIGALLLLIIATRPRCHLAPIPAATAPRARGTAWRCGIFLIGLIVHSSPASLRLVGSSGTLDRRRAQTRWY
jgi:hypothetical protein